MRVNFPSTDALKVLSGNQIPVNMTIPGTVMGTPPICLQNRRQRAKLTCVPISMRSAASSINMLTASLPFLERSLQRRPARHIFAQPEPLRKRAPNLKVSSHLEYVIRRLMAKSRDERSPAM